jgi:hypothetical protein
VTALRAHERIGAVQLASVAPCAPWVMRTSPEDGAVFVLRDTPVLVRLSHPVDPATLSPATLRVIDACGAVPAEIASTADGLLVIWRARRLLVPGVEHVLTMSGLRDRQGREVSAHWSRFVPCGLARDDLRGG